MYDKISNVLMRKICGPITTLDGIMFLVTIGVACLVDWLA